MIGNDIVDLACAHRTSNWQRPRFLDKLFTSGEQNLIRAAADPERLVWLLWSCKESVYKIVHRQTGHRFFAPRKIVCDLLTAQSATQPARARVTYQGQSFACQSEVGPAFIHTVAFSTATATGFAARTFYLAQPTPRGQRQQVCAGLWEDCQGAGDFSAEALEIRKNEQGIPLLFLAGVQQAASLSISHHGCYVAYALTRGELILNQKKTVRTAR